MSEYQNNTLRVAGRIESIKDTSGQSKLVVISMRNGENYRNVAGLVPASVIENKGLLEKQYISGIGSIQNRKIVGDDEKNYTSVSFVLPGVKVLDSAPDRQDSTVDLVGNILKDSVKELNANGGGIAFTTTVTELVYNSEAGQEEETPVFYNVAAFGELASEIKSFVENYDPEKKGAFCRVTARVRERQVKEGLTVQQLTAVSWSDLKKKDEGGDQAAA